MEILFICTGNTCRSPMAEVIFNETYKNAKATSRGLYIHRGSVISPLSKSILNREYGFNEDREAEELLDIDVASADLIITMTEAQKNEVTRRYGGDNVYTLREIAGEEGDIMDPYGMDEETYIETFREIRELIQKTDKFEKYRR